VGCVREARVETHAAGSDMADERRRADSFREQDRERSGERLCREYRIGPKAERICEVRCQGEVIKPLGGQRY